MESQLKIIIVDLACSQQQKMHIFTRLVNVRKTRWKSPMAKLFVSERMDSKSNNNEQAKLCLNTPKLLMYLYLPLSEPSLIKTTKSISL